MIKITVHVIHYNKQSIEDKLYNIETLFYTFEIGAQSGIGNMDCDILCVS